MNGTLFTEGLVAREIYFQGAEGMRVEEGVSADLLSIEVDSFL